jgi:hypothetical protein
MFESITDFTANFLFSGDEIYSDPVYPSQEKHQYEKIGSAKFKELV